MKGYNEGILFLISVPQTSNKVATIKFKESCLLWRSIFRESRLFALSNVIELRVTDGVEKTNARD